MICTTHMYSVRLDLAAVCVITGIRHCADLHALSDRRSRADTILNRRAKTPTGI